MSYNNPFYHTVLSEMSGQTRILKIVTHYACHFLNGARLDFLMSRVMS